MESILPDYIHLGDITEEILQTNSHVGHTCMAQAMKKNFRKYFTSTVYFSTDQQAPDQQGPPPDQQGPPPNQQGPPPNQQGPPPNQQGPAPDDTNICLLPAEGGRCRDRLVRYYYDRDSGACRDFVYTGCEGNGNNFEDEQTCNARCGRPGRCIASSHSNLAINHYCCIL